MALTITNAVINGKTITFALPEHESTYRWSFGTDSETETIIRIVERGTVAMYEGKQPSPFSARARYVATDHLIFCNDM